MWWNCFMAKGLQKHLSFFYSRDVHLSTIFCLYITLTKSAQEVHSKLTLYFNLLYSTQLKMVCFKCFCVCVCVLFFVLFCFCFLGGGRGGRVVSKVEQNIIIFFNLNFSYWYTLTQLIYSQILYCTINTKVHKKFKTQTVFLYIPQCVFHLKLKYSCFKHRSVFVCRWYRKTTQTNTMPRCWCYLCVDIILYFIMLEAEDELIFSNSSCES